MINDHTLSLFEPFGTGMVKPIHDDYSFALIPDTVHYLLTGEARGGLLAPDCFGGSYPAPEKIVLVFVDSFGWQFWQRFADSSRIMRSVADNGVLTPISALFPSTTSASVTTLNLAVPPARHGIYEWNMFVPAYAEVIQSLPFSLLSEAPGSAANRGFDPSAMFLVHETAHQRLARHGVASIQIASRSYANSPYNRLASAGAEIRPYTTLAEALVHLDDAINETPGKAFVNFYWAGLDTAAHIHGPGSAVHDAECLAFWAALDALMGRRQPKRTLWLFTADHGHIAVPAKETVFINQLWPVLRDWLTTGATGKPLWPCGSPRDMFLHFAPERRAEALALLQQGLAGRADVITMATAEAAGLFGAAPLSAEMRDRLGDVLVLPHQGSFVWWHEASLITNRLNGHHGGLTREEMTTILGVAGEL